MRKFLISTILGLTITGGADASIVSRGFFDEQIGNYATLDLLNSKANQKDLTALNDIVGIRNWDIVLNLKHKDFPHLSELFPNLAPDKGMPIPDISNYIYDNLKLIDYPNLAGVTDKFLHGWTNSNKLTRQGLIALNDGWTDKNDGTTYLGLKDLNTKIGTLPDGIPPALATNMEELNERLSVKFDIKYPQSLEDLILDLYGTKEYKPGILQLALWAMSLALEHEDTIIGVQSQNRKGILERIDNVETQIGTLPSGGFAMRPELTELLIWAEQENTYPTSLSELITALYGNPETGKRGLLFGIVGGFKTSADEEIGFGAAKALANKAQATADANTAKIGTVPDGKNLAGMISETDTKIGTLPAGYDSVGAALEAINAKVDNKITNLSATASNGKYVLTAVKEGDQTTYAWESIDRSVSETTTTE